MAELPLFANTQHFQTTGAVFRSSPAASFTLPAAHLQIAAAMAALNNRQVFRARRGGQQVR
jgi:hypothetical protein